MGYFALQLTQMENFTRQKRPQQVGTLLLNSSEWNTLKQKV
jgi:hypothetical protein